jgi:hypothetical protein
MWDVIRMRLIRRRIELGLSCREVERRMPTGSVSRNGLQVVRWENGVQIPTMVRFLEWLTVLNMTFTLDKP